MYTADNGDRFKIVDYNGYKVTVESDGVTSPGKIKKGDNNGQDEYRLTAGIIEKTLSHGNNGSYSNYRKMARRNHKSRKMARKNRKSRNARRNRRNYSRRI